MASHHTFTARTVSARARDQFVGVVVGVDGSPESSTAVQWAADWAHRGGLPLRLVTAYPLAARSELSHGRVRRELHSLLIRQAAGAASRHPDLPMALDIAWTSPAAALVRLSAAAHVVVVGKHGVGRWADVLLGSVAADVSAYAACTVVVCPSEPSEEQSSDRTGHVVVGLDGGENSHATGDLAFAMATLWARPLTAVHVTASPDNILLGKARSAAPVQRRDVLPHPVEATLQDWIRRYPDVRVERRWVQGHPAIQLCRIAERADILVVGSRGRGGFAGLLLGSTSRDVLQGAHCPVAIVRPDGCAQASG